VSDTIEILKEQRRHCQKQIPAVNKSMHLVTPHAFFKQVPPPISTREWKGIIKFPILKAHPGPNFRPFYAKIIQNHTIPGF
jgi:hypothetical protein